MTNGGAQYNVSIKPNCLTCRTYSGVKGQRVPKSPIRGEAKNKIKVLKRSTATQVYDVVGNKKV